MMKQVFYSGLMLSLFFSYSNASDSLYEYQNSSDVYREVAKETGTVFAIGNPNSSYEKYFTGPSYLAALSDDKNVPLFNVTFAPGVVNNWHIHHNSCQVLIGVSGHGYYQIWGEEPKKITPGMSVTIPAGVKHWHGAAKGHWFQHLAYMKNDKNVSTEWFEKVDKDILDSLKSE